MNGSVYVGQKALSLTEYEKTAPISGVILWVDDENCYEAGDETGTVIEQDCPYASQEMANNLLATLQGYSYQGLEANGAKVSPISELGDGLTVNGLYTQLAYQNIRFSTGEVMDVSAPGSDETLHEYKTEGETTKQFNHQIAETRSIISKTSEEILLQVESELDGLSSSFSVQLQQIQSQVTGLDGQMSSITQTVSSITSQITGLDGQISSIEQYVDSITLSVTNGSESSTIQLKAGNTTISSANITFNGMVTFNDLSTAGSTVINGANITTGTISANRINLTGAITWGDLSSSVQNEINNAIDTAETAYDIASGIELPSYIKSTYIDSTRIESPTIIGGEFYAVTGDSYAKMEDDAFSLMYSGSSTPRAVLQVSNSDATLVLGVGNGLEQDAGRFFISKSAIGGGAAAILYALGGYDSVGMAFTNRGEIIFSATEVDFSGTDVVGIDGASGDTLQGTYCDIIADRDITMETDNGDIIMSCNGGDIRLACNNGEFRIYVDGTTWRLDRDGWYS